MTGNFVVQEYSDARIATDSVAELFTLSHKMYATYNASPWRVMVNSTRVTKAKRRSAGGFSILLVCLRVLFELGESTSICLEKDPNAKVISKADRSETARKCFNMCFFKVLPLFLSIFTAEWRFEEDF
eukprot:CAMPEP_0167741244 /NCGR_PEP_ID=MMETSP0110_2-20121227/749_1 /TAXON_ID=629695 /ORGANISM="Gymnochlora sp., Strain CCMP2014" /LENGTH=127 /DNA_ID=CAMNT_0007625275 /DNA_START=325 /DNA_END=708 /DNA_ORIENTATION=+